MLNVPLNNFSVRLGRSHRFHGITSTFGGKYILLKDTTRRAEWVSNPRPLDPESEVLTTRPPRPLNVSVVTGVEYYEAILNYLYFRAEEYTPCKPSLTIEPRHEKTCFLN